MRPLTSIAVLLCGIVAPGCSRQEAKFSHREEYANLIPVAQEQVDTTLAEHFGGSPLRMVAWEKLPLHFSGAVGRVVSAGEDGRQLIITIDDAARPIEAGQTLAWLTGSLAGTEEAAGTTVEIASFDELTKSLTLAEPLSPPPAAGDRFVVDAAGILNHGRVLYAEHCQHCHGVSGDGAGPTARYLDPPPRDFRLGKFKFTSTQSSNRAARGDFERTIEEGIPGTYMPSFKLLEEAEKQALIEYVMWLSMRGETELKLVTYMADMTTPEEVQSYVEEDFQEEFLDDAEFMAQQWSVAQEPPAQVVPKINKIPDDSASIARGRQLFLSNKTKCADCHGPEALGDGPQTLALQQNSRGDVGLYDDWGNPLKPRNLRTGIYRGGRRPIDLFRRISAGIKGTPMASFATSLSDEEIWDIVNYVKSIPFEERHPGEGRSPAPSPAVAAQ